MAGGLPPDAPGPDLGAEEVIQFVGLRELKEDEQDTVRAMCEEYYPKVKQKLHNITSLKFHIKCYQKEGDRKKYSVNLQVDSPTKLRIDSTKAHDWELKTAIHKAFQDVIHQIDNRLHTDTTRPNH